MSHHHGFWLFYRVAQLVHHPSLWSVAVAVLSVALAGRWWWRRAR